MKKFLLATILILSTTLIAASYQGSAVATSANNPQNDRKSSVSDKKIAFIDSRLFPNNLMEYKRNLDKLEAEFQPRSAELETLKNRLIKQDEELKSFIVKDPNRDMLLYKQKAASLQITKKEFERKREDYQEELQNRYDEALTPLRDKIYKTLERYAGARDLTMVLDIATLTEQGSLIYIDPNANITSGFIKEYNTQHP